MERESVANWWEQYNKPHQRPQCVDPNYPDIAPGAVACWGGGRWINIDWVGKAAFREKDTDPTYVSPEQSDGGASPTVKCFEVILPSAYLMKSKEQAWEELKKAGVLLPPEYIGEDKHELRPKVAFPIHGDKSKFMWCVQVMQTKDGDLRACFPRQQLIQEPKLLKIAANYLECLKRWIVLVEKTCDTIATSKSNTEGSNV